MDSFVNDLQNEYKETASTPAQKFAAMGIFCFLLGMMLQTYSDSLVWPAVGKTLAMGNAYALAISMVTLVSGVLTPIAAKLCTIYSKRKIFIISAVGYACCCVLQAFVTSAMVLLLLRTLIGLCCAFLYPACLTLIGDIFALVQRGFWIGVYGALMGAASIVSPVLTGWLLDAFSYRWIFFLIVPFTIVGVTLVVVFLREPLAKHRVQRFDVLGATLLALALLMFFLLTSWGGDRYAWGSPPILVIAVLMLAFGVAAFWRECAVGDDAVLPVGYFKERNFSFIALAAFFSAASATVLYYSLAFYMTTVMGASSLQAGIAVGLQFVVSLLLGPLFGKWIGATGKLRPVMFTSGSLMILIYIFFIFFVDQSTATGWIYGAMVLFGLYAMVITIVYPFAAQNYVRQTVRPIAIGMVHLSQSIAYGVTLSVITACINSFATDIDGAYRLIYAISIGLTLLTILFTTAIRSQQNT